MGDGNYIYYGLSQEYLQSYSSGNLYRGTFISNKELEELFKDEEIDMSQIPDVPYNDECHIENIKRLIKGEENKVR